MVNRGTLPDPSRIQTLDDLADALTRLRRRAARRGQIQLSVRDVAGRAGRPPSTIAPYLRGTRLCPADVFEDILRALGVNTDALRPWLDAWERIADNHPRRAVPGAVAMPGSARRYEILPYSEIFRYHTLPRLGGTFGTIGVITGDLRRVTCADIWVNSENCDMQMSRFEEYSVSAIIRFEGAVHDETGRVVEDRIAEELARKVAGRRLVAPSTAISTGAGNLAVRNGVRSVIHVASVQGEPGEGYRQIADVGRCVTNALAEAERLALASEVRSILFPLLGTGVAGGDLRRTVQVMVGAAVGHLTGHRDCRIRTIYFLASTPVEREVCLAILAANRLVEFAGGSD